MCVCIFYFWRLEEAKIHYFSVSNYWSFYLWRLHLLKLLSFRFAFLDLFDVLLCVCELIVLLLHYTLGIRVTEILSVLFWSDGLIQVKVCHGFGFKCLRLSVFVFEIVIWLELVYTVPCFRNCFGCGCLGNRNDI